MKKIQTILLIFTVAWITAACQKDGETLVVTTPEGASGLNANAAEIVLSADNTDNLALTLYWNNGQAPTVSNPNVSLPDGLVSLTLQMSADDAFTALYEQKLENGGSSVQFTVAALNSIMLRLGFADAELHDVYVRLKTGMNGKASFSETLKLRIAPFIIDMHVMEMQNKDDRSVFAVLRSTDETPDRFEGFAVASAWQKFYFAAADGTLWGTNATTGTAFDLLNTADDDSMWEKIWDCWFADASGCHYIYMDTGTAKWAQVHLPAVTVTADGEPVNMKFSTSTKSWTGVFTTAADDAALTVGGTGARYDIDTGDSGAPKDSPFSISASADGSFRFISGTADTGIKAGKAGTYTLTLDVGNSTWSLAEGGGGPVVTYPAALYAYYYYKEASQRLGLATAMAAREEEGCYEGFVYTDPAWSAELSNFRFLTAMDDTATVYATNSTQYELTSDGSAWNLWSSNTGLNYVVADLAAMSWSETQVAQIAVSGDFNDWSTTADVMQYDVETGKWTATCNISAVGYGFKFVLGDAANAWRWQYGDPDGDGVLQIAGNADNIVPSSAGTYKIELDLNSFSAPAYTLTIQ